MGKAVIFETADTIMTTARSKIQEARDQVVAKASDGHSHNVFIVVHMFDHIWTEIFGTIIAPYLTPLSDLEDLDTVWVLWVPYHVTVWSKRANEWFNVVFTSLDPPDSDSHGLGDIQDADNYFMSKIGVKNPSPYVFGISADQDPDQVDPGGRGA